MSKSSECFNVYLKTILESLVFSINHNKNNWFVLNKQKLQDIVEAGIDILKFDTRKFTSVPFFFQDYQDDSDVIKNLKYH
ncbi:hypothetical protein Phum_PHUM332810 [Pediculus humanus corporis]|uniref:Uncharacterized protein n=1 Tax=Pediculus humanus subsp. corporis TaxID=121224 RepID=E0VNA8_PEDHC|nr:uncharacterized protein Phum_PHUM332810 [Pediculus humanus corporis]EEB14864.1 hypothetical protein Phum_PHUM332810 [Pediculus humanus corporis]